MDLGLSTLSGFVLIAMFAVLGPLNILVYAGYTLLLTWGRLGRARDGFGIAAILAGVLAVVAAMYPRLAFVLPVVSLGLGALVYWQTRQRLLALGPIAALAAAGWFLWRGSIPGALAAWHAGSLALTIAWCARHPLVPSPRSLTPRTPPAPASPGSSPSLAAHSPGSRNTAPASSPRPG